jgi:hypothetical protein
MDDCDQCKPVVKSLAHSEFAEKKFRRMRGLGGKRWHDAQTLVVAGRLLELSWSILASWVA